MLKRSKRLLSAALALAAALSLALAEEAAPVPEVTPAPEITAEPAPEITPEPTAEPTTEPTAEPTTEPTAEPTAEPTTEPTAEPTAEPSMEPSAEPTPGITPEPTAEPTMDPTAEPTAEPSVEPSVEPSLPPEGRLAIAPESQAAQQMEGVYMIPYSAPEEEIAFVWSAVEGADSYLVELAQAGGAAESGAQETILSSAVQAECRAAFPASSLPQGRISLRVTAMQGETALLSGEISFALSQGQGGFPGGMGGFPGGAMGGMTPEEEQGFRITPGEALTDSHSSGTMNRRLYSAAEITASEEPVSAIDLNGEAIASDSAFLVESEGAVLALIPESEGASWRMSLRALEVLHNSGVETLMLGEDCIDTGLALSGAAYGVLRSQGYVSKDFILTMDAAGLHVAVADQSYILHASGELELLRG